MGLASRRWYLLLTVLQETLTLSYQSLSIQNNLPSMTGSTYSSRNSLSSSQTLEEETQVNGQSLPDNQLPI